MPHVDPTKGEVDALIAGISGNLWRDRFGASTVYRHELSVNLFTVPTVIVDDEPPAMGKATAVISYYRLGMPKYGLPKDALVLRLDYACDCKSGVDAPCGFAFCWGTWGHSL
jgi:hypothetical protein